MPAKARIKRYRETGGAADLVRVEVLVPSARRDEIVNVAAKFRAEHRAEKTLLAEFIKIAMERYDLRVFDNIDIDRLNELSAEGPRGRQRPYGAWCCERLCNGAQNHSYLDVGR